MIITQTMVLQYQSINLKKNCWKVSYRWVIINLTALKAMVENTLV